MIDLSLGHYGPYVVVHRPRAVRPDPGYGSPFGMIELRSALAEHLGVPAACVAVSAGATAGLAAIVLADGRPDVLVTPSPGYPGYHGLSELLGLTRVTYDLDSDENLEHAFSRAQGRSVAVWNSPHNPTGRVESTADIQMLDRLADRGIRIVEDRVYGDLKLPDHAVARATDAGSSVIVGSLSKVLALAGERVGFVVADPSTLTSIVNAAWRLSMSVSSASQQVALQNLADPDLEEQIAARRWHRIEAYKIACGVLELGQTTLDDPYFVWLTFPGWAGSIEQIATICRERGVMVASGPAFASTVPAIRLSLTSVPLTDLTTALSIVMAIVSELGLEANGTAQ